MRALTYAWSAPRGSETGGGREWRERYRLDLRPELGALPPAPSSPAAQTMSLSQPPRRTPIIFVNGLHRSGTTVIAEAATEAADGATVTAGLIAERNPHLRELLAAAESGLQVDRGVDARRLSGDLPEEYGWLLRYDGRVPVPHLRARTVPVLLEVIERLAAQDGARAVVLKNPWDFGRERALLELHPDARILLVRRSMTAVSASRRRAMRRYASSDAYLSALMRGRPGVKILLSAIRRRRSRALMIWSAEWGARLRVLAFLARVRDLPLDRVAFISYEELQADQDGADWAAHIIDPDRLQRAVRARLWDTESRPTARPRPADILLDRLWGRVWRERRSAQAARGIVPTQRP